MYVELKFRAGVMIMGFETTVNTSNCRLHRPSRPFELLILNLQGERLVSVRTLWRPRGPKCLALIMRHVSSVYFQE